MFCKIIYIKVYCNTLTNPILVPVRIPSNPRLKEGALPNGGLAVLTVPRPAVNKARSGQQVRSGRKDGGGCGGKGVHASRTAPPHAQAPTQQGERYAGPTIHCSRLNLRTARLVHKAGAISSAKQPV